MPANIAHVLICNKAVKILQKEGGEYQQFIDILDSEKYKPYLNLEEATLALKIEITRLIQESSLITFSYYYLSRNKTFP